MTDYITFEGVTKKFGTVPVVTECSLSIAQSSLVVFLGPSGCGKTTLMRMVGGLDTPTSGTIRLNGEVVAGQHVDDNGCVEIGLGHVRSPVSQALRISASYSATSAFAAARVASAVSWSPRIFP